MCSSDLRYVEKQLAIAGYSEDELSPNVMANIEFARANIKINIYDQAVLEGIATSFPQTEEIIDNGRVSGMTATDVQKILNLKHAWEFILDKDVIASRSDYYMLSHRRLCIIIYHLIQTAASYLLEFFGQFPSNRQRSFSRHKLRHPS